MPLFIIRQDITKMECDAIVNTTNENMIGYSGVDLAVHNAAGEELDAECAALAPLEAGFAKITGGYNLACKYIIHTVGPIWKDGSNGEKAILNSCYTESLNLARQYNCETVAFPLISSGTYGYPKSEALSHAASIISEFLKENEMTVFLCVYDDESYEFSKALFNDIKSFIESCTVREESMQRIGYLRKRQLPSTPVCFELSAPRRAVPESLEDFLKNVGDGFAETLFSFIDAKGITDVECYKRANVDKKTFSKIKCNTIKAPKKRTAVAFAIALELNLEDTKRLLASAGIALTRNNKFDMIIEYFICRGNYNIFEINEALFEFDQELLGSF